MGIFGGKNNDKQSKEEKKIQKFMDKYQLEDLDEKDLVVLRRIANDLEGNNFFKMVWH